MLVFLSGEREIRDTADALRERWCDQGTEVLPLYARLSTAEQQKVFTPAHTGRRIVLATNVAETSLTVPGHPLRGRPGYRADLPLQQRGTKVQRLPIETDLAGLGRAARRPLGPHRARASASGCTRRTISNPGPATPIRRSCAPTWPRSSCRWPRSSSVTSTTFRSWTRRTHAASATACSCCRNSARSTGLGALTEVGGRLARLPLDPRIRRMILAADTENCVREVLVLAAALSIPDPRERPVDREEAARQKHAPFADEHSDFVSYLNLWRYLGEQRKERSGSAFRRMCRDEFLHYLRIREWQDLVGQLRSIAGDLGIRESGEDADPARVHAALTAGLLSHIGLREGDSRDYSGARNTKFVLAPGSVLTKQPPRWIVVADLVETSRLFGRTAARVDPESIERVAGHLVQRTYSEPHWNAQRGAVMAFERVTLYGLPLVPRRTVGYAQVDPAVSRDLFIRHALVEGDWQTRHHFFRDNTALRAELEEMEERARRRDLVIDDRGTLRALRCAHSTGSGVGPALRRMVEEAAAQDTRSADLHPRRTAALPMQPTNIRTPGAPRIWRCR